MIMEKETGVKQSQSNECSKPPAAGRRKEEQIPP